MPRPRPSRSTVSLPPEVRQRLEARGARSDKGHGPFNYTRQIARTIAFYDQLHLASDPRRTQGMREEDYDLVVAALENPLAMGGHEVSLLGQYLLRQPAFLGAARERGVDAAALARTLNAYPFPEKLHLVNTAQARTAAPPPRPARPSQPQRSPRPKRRA